MCTGWEKPGGGWEELRERCCWVSNIAINYEKRSWKRILCPIKKHEWTEVELGRNPLIREENLSWKKFFTEKRREEREGARWRWSQGVVWKILEAHEITIILAIGGIVPRDPPWGLFKPTFTGSWARFKNHRPVLRGRAPGKHFQSRGTAVYRGNQESRNIFYGIDFSFLFLFSFLREFLRPPLFPRRGGFVCVNVDGNLNAVNINPFHWNFWSVWNVVFIVGILGLMSEIVLKWIPCVCV